MNKLPPYYLYISIRKRRVCRLLDQIRPAVTKHTWIFARSSCVLLSQQIGSRGGNTKQIGYANIDFPEEVSSSK